MKAISRGILATFLVVCLGSEAKAEPMRDFLMSCTYGVLAGTLVGAATLAFTNKPGDNLNKIARGASIGLYTGIVLGLYVSYGLSDSPAVETPMPEEDEYGFQSPSWMLVPEITQKHEISGAVLQVSILNF